MARSKQRHLGLSINDWLNLGFITIAGQKVLLRGRTKKNRHGGAVL